MLSEDMQRFNYLTNEINEVYHDAAVRLGLSDSAMMILYTALSHRNSCLIRDIVFLSGMSKQTVNSALRCMERDGYLYLTAADGKKKKVVLTEAGKALADRTVIRIIGIENEIFASWSAEDRRLYIELTRRYLEALKEKTKEL